MALQITRNTRRIYEWQYLREQLKVVHTVPIALGEHPAKVQIIVDAVARGELLLHALGVTGARILGMFPNLLPRTHGVANELFSADVARIRKSHGGGMGQAFVDGGLPVPCAIMLLGITGFPNVPAALGNLAIAPPGPIAAAAARQSRAAGAAGCALRESSSRLRRPRAWATTPPPLPAGADPRNRRRKPRPA